MYQIDRTEKAVTLHITNEERNTTQTITIECETNSFLVEVFLHHYKTMYSNHEHVAALQAINVNRNIMTLDHREEANRVIGWLLTGAYNAIVYAKADEDMITKLMDVAYAMFEDIHQYARECVNDWRK